MLETSRLILRPWEDKDKAPFAALNADPDVMRFFPAPLQRTEIMVPILNLKITMIMFLRYGLMNTGPAT